ncbi:BppU family phage baseplate upper protein [Bacillus sonorensis]|uniref:BppU family phage baseplate upper protein n=1 Tax=Bacillus sonorensis TaxID=119858 RepID=UPI002282D27A|nr:BppU family phage baseplate upper protein [Bacillus sonorensis]MCY8562219.1 BppU family phage baseplate upper protein [Bacillus sonorensis]
MIYKEGEVTFDINAQESPAKSTKIQFFTQDTGSAKLSFSFTKDGAPLPLSAVDAKIVLLYADDSFYKRSLILTDKVNGKAEYVLSDEELKHYGQVRAEIKLYYTNGQAIATVYFTFSIAKTLEDQNIVPVAEYYIDDFESLRTEISQTVEELKAKFTDLENIETKDGAQEKANRAEANAKDYTDTHAKNKDVHITADERKAWNSKETTEGAQEKADKAFIDSKAYTDTHAKNTAVHISTAERAKWNAGQLFKLTEDNGKTFYRGSTETTDYNTLTQTGMYLIYNIGVNGPGVNRVFLLVMSQGNTLVQVAYSDYNSEQSFFRIRQADSITWTPWIEQETTKGAQDKVDTHAKNTTIHVTQSDKDKWNSGQLFKLTEDNGSRKLIADGTDLLTLPSGFYYGVSSKIINSPDPNAVEWFHYDVSTNGTRKTIVVAATANPKRWFGTVHTDGSFKGWQRFITDADLSPAWNTVTLINGATQDSVYPLKFSVSNNVLWLRGSFGTLPAAGTVVAKFVSKPTQVIDFIEPTIGSYGSARFAFTTDGELRFDGFINVNDESKVTRVSMNEPIPLW